jgi:adenylate cyclase
VTTGPGALAHLRHELRTPLNHIMGYAELLLEDAGQGDERIVADLRRLLDDARAVLAIVNERLAPGGRDADTVDVAALGRDVLDSVARIVTGARTLAESAEARGAQALLPDLARIGDAADRLVRLLAPGPASAGGEGRPAGEGAAGATGSSRGVILVVDDDQGNRDLLARRLAREGFAVRTAADGQGALEVLATPAEPPIDLVLLDVMMPGIDGYEVLRRLKGAPALRELPVLMISALDEVGSVVRCIELGAEDYLPKPFDPVLLRARIGACLEKKRFRDLEARHARELAEWNRTLEQRVAEQVGQVERLARLKRFFSPQLAELILAGGATDPLASHRVEVTVVFLDLRGFTAFAETADPEEVMGILREFHAAMGRLILEHEGTLERFTGDGMMIFFNDPVPVPDAPVRAVRMALAMRERARELDVGWRKRGHDLGMGVGIAQGYATIGAIGFEGRWDYGAIGTVTNLAARLCGEAGSMEILVSQRVAGAVEDLASLEPVGPLHLKGFARPVPAFRLQASRESQA